MVMSAVSRMSGTGEATGAGSNSTVALSSTLSRCQQQLGDWMACASAKTPEGKKIIENLRVRISRLEDQVARNRPPSSASASTSTSTTPQPSASPLGTPFFGNVGGLLNVVA